MCVLFPNRTALMCPTIFNFTNLFKCTLLLIVSRFVTTCFMNHSKSFIDLVAKNRSTGKVSICYYSFMSLHCIHRSFFIRLVRKRDVHCEHLWQIYWRADRRFRSLSQTLSMVYSWKLVTKVLYLVRCPAHLYYSPWMSNILSN